MQPTAEIIPAVGKLPRCTKYGIESDFHSIKVVVYVGSEAPPAETGTYGSTGRKPRLAIFWCLVNVMQGTRKAGYACSEEGCLPNTASLPPSDWPFRLLRQVQVTMCRLKPPCCRELLTRWLG